MFEFQGTGPAGPDNRVDMFECSVPGTDIGPDDCKWIQADSQVMAVLFLW